MNRIICNSIVLFSLIFGNVFLAAAQTASVPSTVYGLTLGKVYNDSEIRRVMDEEHHLNGTTKYKGSGDYLELVYTFSSSYGVFSFGGLEWDYVDLNLHKSVLFQILFVRHFDEYPEAQTFRDSLLNKLKRKYGEAFFSDGLHCWSSKNNTIFLELTKAQARNNKHYYYVHLIYDDAKIVKKLAEAENSEL